MEPVGHYGGEPKGMCGDPPLSTGVHQPSPNTNNNQQYGLRVSTNPIQVATAIAATQIAGVPQSTITNSKINSSSPPLPTSNNNINSSLSLSLHNNDGVSASVSKSDNLHPPVNRLAAQRVLMLRRRKRIIAPPETNMHIIL